MKTSRLRFLPALLLAGVFGCRPQPDASPPGTEATGPGPDTTFYQEASWAPDGSRLSLSRLDIHDAYRSSIALVQADGAGYTRLTEGPNDRWTSWSADGARIAYASEKEDNVDIYVMQADGSELVRLTTDPAEDTHPDWSLDGARIAFVSDRTGAAQVYVMNADGTGQTQISDTPEEKWNPRWSPDGRQLVFYGAPEPGNDSVYVMNADGSERRTLGAGVWPSWSPDGSKILFAAEDHVYVMSAEGEHPTRLLDNAMFARWSPDGARIAFIRVTWQAPEGWPAVSDLFTVQADGSGERRLTGR